MGSFNMRRDHSDIFTMNLLHVTITYRGFLTPHLLEKKLNLNIMISGVRELTISFCNLFHKVFITIVKNIN